MTKFILMPREGLDPVLTGELPSDDVPEVLIYKVEGNTRRVFTLRSSEVGTDDVRTATYQEATTGYVLS